MGSPVRRVPTGRGESLRALAIALLLLLSSQVSARAKPMASWTVLFYVAVDIELGQDLDAAYAETLAAIAETPPSDDVQVVVLFDRSHALDQVVPPGACLPRWRGSRTFHLGACGLEPMWSQDDWNTGAAGALRSFVERATRCYPSDRTALFLLSHGSPIMGTCGDEGQEPKDFLQPREIREALQGLEGVAPLDLLVFACCEMGTLEAVQNVAPQARFVLAGEDILWTDNLDYPTILCRLDANPCMDGAALGRVCLESCDCQNDRAAVERHKLGGRNEWTVLSLVDGGRVNALSARLNDLGDALRALEGSSPEAWDRLHALRMRCMDFGCGCYGLPGDLTCGSRGPTCFVDLQQFVCALHSELGGVVEGELGRLERALDDAVIASIPNPLFGTARGLGVLLPPVGSPVGEYRRELPGELTPWLGLLDRYGAWTPRSGPAITKAGTVLAGGSLTFPGAPGLGLVIRLDQERPLSEAWFGLGVGAGAQSDFTGWLPLRSGPVMPGQPRDLQWPTLDLDGASLPLPIIGTSRVRPGSDLRIARSLLVLRRPGSPRPMFVVLQLLLGPDVIRLLAVGTVDPGGPDVRLELRTGDELSPCRLRGDLDGGWISTAARLALDASGAPVVGSGSIRVGATPPRVRWAPIERAGRDLHVAAVVDGLRPRFTVVPP